MATRSDLARPRLSNNAALGDEPLDRVASGSSAFDLRLGQLKRRPLTVNGHVLTVQARADVLLQFDPSSASVREVPPLGALGELLEVRGVRDRLRAGGILVDHPRIVRSPSAGITVAAVGVPDLALLGGLLRTLLGDALLLGVSVAEAEGPT